MSKTACLPMEIFIGHSKILGLSIDGVHGFSLLTCWLNDLPLVVQLAASLLVAVSWRIQRVAYHAASVYLRYTVAGDWRLSFDGEHFFAVAIRSTTVTASMLTILHFTIEGKNRSLVIVKDAVNADDYRKLIVNLKISGCGYG